MVYDHDLKLAIINKMVEYGGAFAHRLAEAWAVADSGNAARIEAAFPELLGKYASMVLAESK